jgi:AcrR family transcriptional regulator
MTVAAARNPADAPPISSHERILLAAKQLFATRGYESTSTVAIARQAGTSESQLIKHFGSKEGLLEAIFDRGWAGMADIFKNLKNIPSPTERLRSLIEQVIRRLDADAELRDLLLLEGRRIRKEGRQVLLTGGFLELVRLIDGTLAEMRSQGQLLADVNLQALRSALMGMLEGMLRDQILASRAGYPAEYPSTELRKIFDLLLSTITAK